MATATIPPRSDSGTLPSEARAWDTDRLTDEAVRAIQTCRTHGQAAARHAWRAGAFLSLLHAKLVKGRRWAAWLRRHRDVISEDTARRYILLYERTGGRVTELDGMTLTEAYAAFGITRFMELAKAEPGSNGNGPINGHRGFEADHRSLPPHKTPAVNGANGVHEGVEGSLAPVADGRADTLAGLDEEAILRAAAEIRQRRVAEQLRQAQERRRLDAPARLKRRKGSPVLHGDCLDLIPTLEDDSVGLVVTSPPYAEQRKGHYGGIPEVAYPEFTVQWMEALRPKLKDDGSALIVIRPHLRAGVLSDYVLRTRLALREASWKECEEMIWVKPDAPPLGSKLRPRRSWESILWFSKSSQPYCDLKACGKESDRLGFRGAPRFAQGGISERTGWHPCVESFGYGSGTARISDVFVAPVGGTEPGVDHPAMFPQGLAEPLIETYSVEGDLVLDLFCGSGQSLLAAKGCGRRYLGFERDERYVQIALGRLER